MAEILRTSHAPAPCLSFPQAMLNTARAIIFKRSLRLPFSHWHGAVPGLITTQLVMHQAISSDREGQCVRIGRRQQDGPALPDAPFMGCSITHEVSDPQEKEQLSHRHRGTLLFPSNPTGLHLAPLPAGGCWGTQGAEGCRMLREGASGSQIHANCQAVTKKHIALRSVLTCSVLASFGCP